MTCQIHRPRERMLKLGIRSSAYHEAIQNGLIAPTFSILGSRGQGAFAHEDDEVLEARAAGATDDQVRAIVRRQVERRKARFDELKVA